jgi:hypothetical protein
MSKTAVEMVKDESNGKPLYPHQCTHLMNKFASQESDRRLEEYRTKLKNAVLASSVAGMKRFTTNDFIDPD